MLFNSYEFLFLFLPIALLGYYLVPRRARLILLTLLSYGFYGWWDYRFCGLMFFSTAFDYIAGLLIGRSENPRARRRWMAGSVVVNLSVLGFFKYFDLLADTTNRLAAVLGADNPILPLLHVILPAGVSFYTFESMSYTIDVYYRVIPPQKSLWNYAFFVSFFPHLIAGPILRYRDMAAQMESRTHTWAKFAAGISFFILGLSKKVILADGVAPLAGAVFKHSAPGFGTAWTGLLAYAAQIYFDFSAYSDMAVGLGLFFGFRLPQNFDSPYKSVSITDFWRRWHMSLSTWLRDYLYVPLGGNRKGPIRTYINLFLTMLLGGLWHGASWTFVLWGAYHGCLLAIERASGKRSLMASFPVAVQRASTFLLVLLGWLFFRCESMGQVVSMLRGMTGLNGWVGQSPIAWGRESLHLALLAFSLVLAFAAPNSWQIRWRGGWLAAAILGILFVLSVMTMMVNTSSPFLYFQF